MGPPYLSISEKTEDKTPREGRGTAWERGLACYRTIFEIARFQQLEVSVAIFSFASVFSVAALNDDFVTQWRAINSQSIPAVICVSEKMELE